MQQNESLHENLNALVDAEEQPCVLETRVRHECNRFTDDMRKTVLRLQAESNVPASKCSFVISNV